MLETRKINFKVSAIDGNPSITWKMLLIFVLYFIREIPKIYLTNKKIQDYNSISVKMSQTINAMTKRVTVSGKLQRAGEGGRPVQVEGQRKSLPSRQDKRQEPDSPSGRGFLDE